MLQLFGVHCKVRCNFLYYGLSFSDTNGHVIWRPNFTETVAVMSVLAFWPQPYKFLVTFDWQEPKVRANEA